MDLECPECGSFVALSRLADHLHSHIAYACGDCGFQGGAGDAATHALVFGHPSLRPLRSFAELVAAAQRLSAGQR